MEQQCKCKLNFYITRSVEHCGASDEYAEIVYFGKISSDVIIIEDMILKMSVKNLGKNE